LKRGMGSEIATGLPTAHGTRILDDITLLQELRRSSST